MSVRQFVFVAPLLLLFTLSTNISTHAQSSQLTLPPATAGMGYAAQLSLDGMELATPITIDVSGLPKGLTFDASSRTISGNPKDDIKDYQVKVVISDANGKKVTVDAKIALKEAKPTPVTAGALLELPDAMENQAYKVAIQLPTGATDPVLSGLTKSLTLNTAATEISGTPKDDPADGDYPGSLTFTQDGVRKAATLRMRLHLAPPTVKIAMQCGGTPTIAPTITSIVTDLTPTISGTAAVPKGCSAKIIVWAVDPSNEDGKLDYLQRHPSAEELQHYHGVLMPLRSGQEVAADGTFSVQLTGAPRAGQMLLLQETFSDASQAVAGSIFSAPIPAHFAGDWGRLRTYFTSGILLSQNQGSFSQSSLFLSFLMDKSWMLPGPVANRSSWRPGISSFFETRLTSVPITAQPCPSGSTPGGQCSNQGPTEFNTFLTSQKTARLSVGTYLPFIAKTWTYNGVRNGLFIGPLAKIGFDTPTSPIDQSQAQSQSAGAGNQGGSAVAPVNDSSFYNFYVYGGRIGHMSLPAPEKARTSDAWVVNEAPEINSYLDIAVGRFSNLQSILSDGAHRRLYRISIEGLLKVPSTPLVIGFNANLGQAYVGVNTVDIRQKAADDLRFLIGAKFDVGKITTYLTGHAF